MFDFDLGDELDLIVETARSFAEDELFPKLRDHESARTLDSQTRGTYAEMGFAGLELPNSLGGAELGALARCLVNEELAAGDVGAALALDPVGPALYPLAEVGGETAVREFALPLLEADDSRAAFVGDGDASLEIGDVVSGFVPWVPADRIDLLVIQRGSEVLAVREGFEAVSVRGAGARAAGASELRLERAPVAARWSDPMGAIRARARVRLYYASLLVGVMRQAAEFSREYALEREAFGRPIAHHQGLAFLITDMRMAVDGARVLLHEAAWRVDRRLACGAAAAAAYADAIEASRLVGPNGVQILGGHGFMQDYPVEKYMREARMLGLMLGGIDAAHEDAGQAITRLTEGVPLSHLEGVVDADAVGAL